MERKLIEGTQIFLIQDFLSASECGQHVERCEALGFETFTIGGDVPNGYRNNARVMMDDVELAKTLWQRAADFMPTEIESQSVTGLNSRFRYYRYTGSESFAPHYDGSVRVGESTSKLTFLVYLANVAKGGATRFYDDDLKISHSIQPRLGSALIFEHAILHEGVAVEDGTKYVLRTDVMYG